VNITSDHFVYTDDDRVAHYEGHVLMTSEDGTLTAQRLDVYLKPRSETQGSAKSAANASSGQPSQIDHAVAQENVVLTQPGRRGTGEKLAYTDADQKFVLTGTENEQPQVSDVQHGVTRGDRLIFFRGADNRILVESTGVERAYTQTRVK
jgi:lipopolysaccharide export system protein LptA